jgi:hypothetical protein
VRERVRGRPFESSKNFNEAQFIFLGILGLKRAAKSWRARINETPHTGAARPPGSWRGRRRSGPVRSNHPASQMGLPESRHSSPMKRRHLRSASSNSIATLSHGTSCHVMESKPLRNIFDAAATCGIKDLFSRSTVILDGSSRTRLKAFNA